MRTALEESRMWERRAEENYAKAEQYKNRLCRLTMESLGRDCEAMALRAAKEAVAEQQTREPTTERVAMYDRPQPYEIGLVAVLREYRDRWSGPKGYDKVDAADIGAMSKWQGVRLLARIYNKSNRQVARDLINTYRGTENGYRWP